MKFRSARQIRLNRYRRALGIAAIVCIPVGLWTKRYSGIGEAWVNGSAGAIVYEMFWICLVGIVFPELSAWSVAIAIFLITSGLECLQLWQSPTLNAIQETTVGRLLLGSVFSPWDFLYYALGCLLGWLVLRQCHRSFLAPRPRDRI